MTLKTQSVESIVEGQSSKSYISALSGAEAPAASVLDHLFKEICVANSFGR